MTLASALFAPNTKAPAPRADSDAIFFLRFFRFPAMLNSLLLNGIGDFSKEDNNLQVWPVLHIRQRDAAGTAAIICHCSTIRTGASPHLTKTETHSALETETITPTWLIAVRAAESKKAADIKVLDLTGITSFADHFVICTGNNQKQVQAIAEEVGLQIKRQARELPHSVEGYNQAEWVLADYGDLVVHVFSPKAREYYDLERLWRSAKTVEVPSE